MKLEEIAKLKENKKGAEQQIKRVEKEHAKA
jgi:hypothetical protein